MSPSTLKVPAQQFGTMGVTTQWGVGLEARTMASIMLGIEQASKNEGTMLTDADLATDDDD